MFDNLTLGGVSDFSDDEANISLTREPLDRLLLQEAGELFGGFWQMMLGADVTC